MTIIILYDVWPILLVNVNSTCHVAWSSNVSGGLIFICYLINLQKAADAFYRMFWTVTKFMCGIGRQNMLLICKKSPFIDKPSMLEYHSFILKQVHCEWLHIVWQFILLLMIATWDHQFCCIQIHVKFQCAFKLFCLWNWYYGPFILLDVMSALFVFACVYTSAFNVFLKLCYSYYFEILSFFSTETLAMNFMSLKIFNYIFSL